jgi:hypothetical protein
MRIIREFVDAALTIQGGEISLRLVRGGDDDDFCHHIERSIAS